MATQRGLWVSQRMHDVEVIAAGHLERLCMGTGRLAAINHSSVPG